MRADIRNGSFTGRNRSGLSIGLPEKVPDTESDEEGDEVACHGDYAECDDRAHHRGG